MKIVGEPVVNKGFPVEKVAKMFSITVKTNTGQTVEIEYRYLRLKIINKTLCFYYESADGDLIFPILRLHPLKEYLKRHNLM